MEMAKQILQKIRTDIILTESYYFIRGYYSAEERHLFLSVFLYVLVAMIPALVHCRGPPNPFTFTDLKWKEKIMQRSEYDHDWNYEEETGGQKQNDRSKGAMNHLFILNKRNPLSKHQDAYQIRENFKKYVEDANSSNREVRQKAQEGACRDLEFFIMKMIARKFSTYVEQDSSFYEDLLQAGRLGIMMALPKYDPDKSMPTTYFFNAIRHEMVQQASLMKHDTKSHVATIKRKIQDVDKRFERYGRTPALHDYVYSMEDSFTHIINALAEMKGGNTRISFDDPNAAPFVDALDSMHKPEDAIISTVNFNRILSAAREIEPDEVIIQCFIEASEGTVKTAQLAEKYHRSSSEIKERIQNLKNLLKCHDDIRKLYPERFSQEEEG